ncbi:Outer membrane protein OmpA [Pseudomonas indica]|uniref:Outer membrane protein OmpA n=1 Tax=Pseudomonas indica TaxID=137658 RepID=A0A1G9L8T1_9PSED|nr:Outer membrane protein OmpA [Pseudomonas indica]
MKPNVRRHTGLVLAEFKTGVFTPMESVWTDPKEETSFMSMTRTAVPLLLATSVLTGCAGLQKSDWPTCAALGGLTGAAIGAIESSSYAGWGALAAGTTAGAYCWVHGQGEEETVAAVEEQPMPEPTPMPEAAEPVRVELDVKFDFDKSVVKPESYDDIRSLADFMKQYPQTSTVVEGHTDSIGTDAYNQGLSERRANAVRDVLVNQYGIEGSRVDTVGYGESRPVADNATDAGRAINRRVEAEVEARP